MRDVLMVGPVAPPPGGVANFISETSTRLDQFGFRVTVSRVGARESTSRLAHPIVEVADLLRFGKLLRARTAALVHIHSSSYFSYYRSAAYARRARKRNAKTIFHVHGGEFDKFYRALSSRRQRRLRTQLGSTDLIVVTSPTWVAFFRDEVRVDRPIEVVQNGYDPRIYSPGDRAEARKRLRLGVDERLIVTIGNLDPVKGHSFLIDAIATLRDEGVPVRAAIIGEGRLRPALEAQLRQRGLSDQVALPGRLQRSANAEWLRAADIFALPSTAEGSPTVMFESLAVGVPFVGSAVGGIPDVIRDANGILVPPGKVDALTNALRAGMLRTWDPTSVAATVAGHSWDAIAQRLADIYDRV